MFRSLRCGPARDEAGVNDLEPPATALSKSTHHHRASRPPRSPNPRRRAEPLDDPGQPWAKRPDLKPTHDRVLDCTNAERWAESLWYLDRLIAARPDDATLHDDRAEVYGKLSREANRQADMARVFELGG